MPVNTHHPDYDKMSPEWKIMRDTAAGQRAIHDGQEAYLPKLSEESAEDYAARIKRTPFFEATWRTIEGLRGMLFRKAPARKVSTGAESMLEDVTKSGVGIDAFALKVAEEALTLGRVGVMVDYPSLPPRTDGRTPTVAEIERLNLRPHLALYPAESVINWKAEWKNNRSTITRVVLEERAEIPDPLDRFMFKSEPRWRVLELDDAGAYVVTVYKKGSDGQDEIVSGPSYPQMKGKPLREIPFQFIGTDDCTPAVDLPPLLGLANMNISHYQTTADLELGAHRTALPTPYIAGNVTPQVGPDGKPIPITLHMGGSTAWVLPGQNVTVGMLEYQGTGLGSLENRIVVKERQMAVLGARMLEQQKAGVETAEAAGIHRSGEQSALAAIGATISKGIQQALAWFDTWAGGDGKAEFKLNDEFFPAQLTAQEITALVGAWQDGALSAQELFEKFQKGGVVRDGKEYEEHETEITTNPPMLSSSTTPQNDALAA